MPRLLILYTGGTIGMRPSPAGYVPGEGFAERLATQLAAHGGATLPEYRLVELQPAIDSADLTPEAWNRIVAVLARHWDAHDGVVILHGTDTLAYTASALSFMLGALDKPVMLTGAQLPLGEPRSDAPGNVATAMQAAVAPGAPREVCVVFHDRVLRGNRARKVRSQGMDAFDSPNAPWLGEAGIELRLGQASALPGGTPDFSPVAFEADRVGVLHCHPGMSARQAEAMLEDARLQGLVLLTYGVGNPPSHEGRFLAGLQRATARGLVTVNLTQCHQGRVRQGAYATGAVLNAAGVVAGRDMTPEAAVTKLQVLLGRGLAGDALREAMTRPLRGEMTLSAP
ncbi:asparaginase [Halomonas heilongjiangensis]|uniref:asparaginase n=1 Tax=Halomonas heilongjiangensis TaxID=1387883 RepID=A0A2N7TP39_9GAMM|nr:type I asparaginase [Halomonas heilongjiangensis]PMR69942.1 L-asparaginase 1 [Halomonas heilongjiangensis]PXX94101.1 L-asparaginase 1 [Halomonas heilongjiangensis]